MTQSNPIYICLLLCLIGSIGNSKLSAQDFYWTFEGESGLSDTKKGQPIYAEKKKVELRKDPDGRSFLRIKPNSSQRIRFCKVPEQPQFSMEFLSRYDVETLGFDPQVIDASYPSLKFYLDNSKIGFATFHELRSWSVAV
ncbi:MAG: hypothetical protein AAF705_16875, partial [Bacteroidota bacterium]